MKFVTLSDGRIMNMDLAEEINIQVLTEKEEVMSKDISDKKFTVPMLEVSAVFISKQERILFNRITFTYLLQLFKKWDIRMPNSVYEKVCDIQSLTQHDRACIQKAYEMLKIK